jgi:hypothetical protein
VNSAIKICIPYNAANFLAKRATVSFSKDTLLHGVTLPVMKPVISLFLLHNPSTEVYITRAVVLIPRQAYRLEKGRQTNAMTKLT